MKIATIKRRLKFDAGHRLYNHQGKCASLHGHEYKVWVYARALKLDDQGMVIDFSVIKEKLGNWIDTNWDHNFIVSCEDQELINLLKQVKQDKDIFIMPNNPTAENMATYLLYEASPDLFKDTDIEIYKIELWETENSCAEIELNS